MSNKMRWYLVVGILAVGGVSALNGCAQADRLASLIRGATGGAGASSAASLSSTTTGMKNITDAASNARRQCQEFMHEDADEFVSCIDAVIARSVPGELPQERAERQLGNAYFAWVGANNSARIGLPGAASATDQYRRLFQLLQRRLDITDTVLCAAVAGDCALRLAQLQAQSQL